MPVPALILIALLMLTGMGTLGFGMFLYVTGRTMRRLREERMRRLDKPPPPIEEETPLVPVERPILPDPSDLRVYPARLEGLEAQLAERVRSVEQQRGVVEARLADLQGKGGREDLSRKYGRDSEVLARRMEGMRRVLGQVWKTRAVLLMRVHLASTARQKPDLEDLPDPGYRPVLPEAPGRYHAAAAAVRRYLERVDAQRGALVSAIPRPPVEAAVDGAIRQVVEAEYRTVEADYRQLRDQMDRLSDNLTWLGDHLNTVRVVEDDRDGGPGAEAARLLEEIGVAVDEVDRLAHAVDPHLVDVAVDNLAEDISRLEQAGEEAAAEAAAALEVEELLKQIGGR